MTLASQSVNTFEPNWVSVPGDTISNVLKDKGISLKDFAYSIDKSERFVSSLIRGHENITEDLALTLEDVLGASAEFWLNRQNQYTQDLQRLQIKNSVSEEVEWVKALPTKKMQEYGWLKPTNSIDEKIEECMKFFGVSNLEAWRNRYQHTLEFAAFRTSPSFESDMSSVAAWFRQGELQAQKIKCSKWDSETFRRKLSDMKKLSRRRSLEEALPELIKECANCGVALAIVRAPTGCKASGATRFLNENKALIILSFRYLSDDHFWFTFFHEAAHLILHGKDAIFLENENHRNTYQEEREANEFSEKVLIPEEYEEEFSSLSIRKFALARFAKELGIATGILIGQLQHSGRLSRQRYNKFKVRYTWDEINRALKLATESDK